MFQSVSKNVSYLAELGEEVGHAVLAVPELAEGERDEHGGEEVGEGVVQVGVLRQPAPALQECEHGRPGAQEQERRQHDGDGAALVLDQVHREAGSDGGQGAQERALEHLQGGSKWFQQMSETWDTGLCPADEEAEFCGELNLFLWGGFRHPHN